ncbi:MAG: hypothetical protein GY820_00665 [Gammaproteobacteria bacterium]|nr:hypothetical protein [Gammaproteobacteria bacterium]
MLQDEYYVIERENNDNYPLVSWDESRGGFGLGKPVVYKGVIKLRLGEPISPNFEWVDYHSNSTNPVVSKIIIDALAPKDIYGIQLVPAKIRNPKDSSAESKSYWFMHIWNRITCMDSENSELELYDDGSIFGIERLTLDESVLGRIELKERLIFELAEKTSVLLVHKVIKDTIEVVNPKGCRFFKVSDWYSDIAFD